MLERNCVIRKGIEGLDPDQDEDYQLKKWLRDHPEKKTLSKTERGKIAQKFAATQGVKMGISDQKFNPPLAGVKRCQNVPTQGVNEEFFLTLYETMYP